MEEPVAAALTFVDSGQFPRAGTILVVLDLGDSTFDTCVLQYDGTQLRLEHGPRGDSSFGGANYRRVLYENFCKQAKLKGSIYDPAVGVNLAHPSVPQAQRRSHLQVSRLADTAMRELGDQDATTQVFADAKGNLKELTCPREQQGAFETGVASFGMLRAGVIRRRSPQHISFIRRPGKS